MDENISDVLYENIKIDSNDLLDKIIRFELPLIKSVAENFKSSIENISDLLALPAHIATNSFLYYAIKKTLENAGPDADAETIVKSYLNTHYTDQAKKEIAQISISFIKRLLPFQPGFSKSMQSLIYSSVLYTWVSFEILATALFANIMEYRANNSLPIIKGDFRFSTTYNIKKTYIAVFGNSFENEIKKIIFNPELILLEKTRHLIAHRHGILDKKYKDEVEELALRINIPANICSTPLGASVFIEMELERQFIEAALEAAYKLLSFVDAQLNLTSSQS